MRILYRCGAFPPQIGGLEVLSGQLVQSLCERGHEVMVLTSSATTLPADVIYRGVRVLRVPFLQTVESRDLPRFRKLVQVASEIQAEFNPDIVHLNLSGPEAMFYPYAPASVGISVLHAPIDLQLRSVLGRLLGKADWVVAVSRSLLDDALAFLPQIRSHASTIHNSLMMPTQQPTELPFDPPTLLCIGRLVRDKGFDIALKAFSQVRQKYAGVRLIVAGNGVERRSLEHLASELRLNGSIEFTGWVYPEEVPELINRATAVLMPGRWREPFGLVALQAAQMARPLIATPLGGLPEIAVDGDTCTMVEPENPDALADGILSLLADPARARRMGANARAYVEQHFSFERFLDSYEQLYGKVLRMGSRSDLVTRP